MRNPALVELLDACAPVGTTEVEWSRPLRLTAYIGVHELPDELITSIRVIVLVGDQVVVCTNRDGGSHVWPGGHRETGETHVETACREVHEETGWRVDPASVEPIGFIHLFNVGEPNPPYPHPDSIQLVVVGRAVERAADEWTDVEGWEVSSQLRPLTDVGTVEAMCWPFLREILA